MGGKGRGGGGRRETEGERTRGGGWWACVVLLSCLVLPSPSFHRLYQFVPLLMLALLYCFVLNVSACASLLQDVANCCCNCCFCLFVCWC